MFAGAELSCGFMFVGLCAGSGMGGKETNISKCCGN